MFGNCKGRAVYFDHKGDMSTLIYGEGIETVLSACQATGMNGAAALSTSGMKSVLFHEDTEIIYIVADSDPVREKTSASMAGQQAAVIMAKNFESSRKGRRAFIVSTDDNAFTENPIKRDFNDLLKADPTGSAILARFDKAVRPSTLKWSLSDLNQEHKTGRTRKEEPHPPETIAELHKINEFYAGVLLGSDWRIVKESYDENAKKYTVAFLKQSAFFAFMSHRKVKVWTGAEKNIEYKELAKVWSGWSERRTYENVIFDPSEKATSSTYNLFRGFPLKPAKGDWSLMRKHIYEVICDSNLEHYEYLMAWMARAVQDPGGEKPGVAIVLKGGKGIGKGVFVNYFGTIFGDAFLPIADSESFTGRFNMHLSKSLLVFLDEAVWGGDKKAEGKLKQLITEPRIMFEPKGIDSMALDSFINVIIASNEDWVVPATGDERRFCVLQPSATFQQNTDYFREIANERDNGGVEAMMYDLMQLDYKSVNLRRAPHTVGLSEQVQASLPSVLEFWYSILDRGFLLSDRESGGPINSELTEENNTKEEIWPRAVFKHEIHTEYTQWCRLQHRNFPKSVAQFWKETFAFWPGGTPKRIQRRNSIDKIVDALLIPRKIDLMNAFTQTTKVEFDIEDDPNGRDLKEVPFDNQF